MTTTTARPQSEIDAAVTEMKAEILRDMANANVIAAPVTCFADLNDHVDANEYGGFTDPQRRADWSTDDLTTVHDAIDAWLTSAADSDDADVLCEVCGIPYLLGDEPGQVQASGRWVTVCSVACTGAALTTDA